jgi:hypothetical protein
MGNNITSMIATTFIGNLLAKKELGLNFNETKSLS